MTDMDDSKSAKVRIRLVDKNGTPVSDAGITASVWGASAESVTDMDGRANFPKTPLPSKVEIVVEIPGRPLFETNLRHEKDDEDHLVSLPYEIEQKGVVCFKIVDSTGKKVKGLPVRIEYSDETINDKTDEDGKTIFSDIPVGKQVLFKANCHDKENSYEKKFLFAKLEETHEIVLDAPTKSRKRLRFVLCLCVFAILVFGTLGWIKRDSLFTLKDSGVHRREQPGLTEKKGDCGCEVELEELRQEIERLKTEISEMK